MRSPSTKNKSTISTTLKENNMTKETVSKYSEQSKTKTNCKVIWEQKDRRKESQESVHSPQHVPSALAPTINNPILWQHAKFVISDATLCV